MTHFPDEVAFPFQRNYFAAVVLRFPAAMTDAALAYTVGECKRVLAPGGHLEVCTVDIDIFKAGTVTRRAVKALKTRVAQWDPEASLKPASDHVQHLLGRRGFDRVNRCVVKVPISTPSALIAGARAEDVAADADADADVDAAGPAREEALKDILEHGASAAAGRGDAEIGRTVSRVGRWWYSRCYEEGALRAGVSVASIWEEEGVLAECERLDSSLKVLLCYARKPEVDRRRTKSL